MRPTVIEINCETGIEIERPMTDEEFNQYKLDQEKNEAKA